MEKIKTYKRSKYFIKKKFQAEIILKFSMVLFIGILLSTALLFLFSQDTLTSSYANSGLEIKNTGTAIMPAVILTNLITLGIISIFSIIVMLFISHKIAGPMFRFEKDLKRVSKGDLTVKVNLRKKDQFKDMALGLNQMIQSMYTKVMYIDTQLSKIQKSHNENKKINEEITLLRSKIHDSFILNK